MPRRSAPKSDDELVFVEDDAEPATMPLRVKDAPEPLKRVRVVAPFQVVYDTVYRPGDIAQVPADVAASWLRNSWVTEA